MDYIEGREDADRPFALFLSFNTPHDPYDAAPADLKAAFGRRMAFWGGGIDAQGVLPTADPPTIRRHVRKNLAAFKPGGGYVFNNVHNIQADVPPENILALFDAAAEFGAYD